MQSTHAHTPYRGTQHPQTSIQTYTRTAWHHKAPSYHLIHIPSHQDSKPTIPLPLQGTVYVNKTSAIIQVGRKTSTCDVQPQIPQYISKPDTRPPRQEPEGKISQLDAAQYMSSHALPLHPDARRRPSRIFRQTGYRNQSPRREGRKNDNPLKTAKNVETKKRIRMKLVMQHHTKKVKSPTRGGRPSRYSAMGPAGAAAPSSFFAPQPAQLIQLALLFAASLLGSCSCSSLSGLGLFPVNVVALSPP